jgi:lipopolysaccharide/colanic/teichoic acid biosynthesis glycosyltransferase
MSGQMSGLLPELIFFQSLAKNRGAGYFDNIRPGLSGLAKLFLKPF